MKFVVLHAETGSAYGVYEADAPDAEAIRVEGIDLVHISLPEGKSFAECVVSRVDDQWVVQAAE